MSTQQPTTPGAEAPAAREGQIWVHRRNGLRIQLTRSNPPFEWRYRVLTADWPIMSGTAFESTLHSQFELEESSC
jgi:hypothetical protein